EDVDEHPPPGRFLQLLPELVDFRALAADDDAGPRGVDVDLQVVGRALDVDARHAGVREALLEIVAKLQILVKELRVILVGVPARSPGLVEAEPESVRMNLLTHAPSGTSKFELRSSKLLLLSLRLLPAPSG